MSVKFKSILVISVLTVTVIVLAALLMLESAKTKTSGDLLEELIVNENKIEYTQELSSGDVSELSDYLRDHDFYFTNVLEIYDEHNENIIYRIEYRYNNNDEIFISNIERME